MFNTHANCGGYSLSDIAAVSNGGRSNNGWDGDGSWWIILLFLFCLGGNGWGWGNNGGNGGGSTTREEISYGFDMNGIENGIRGIQTGLCDGFYAQNSTALTGFNGLNTAITSGVNSLQSDLCKGFNGINTAMLQGFNGIQSQMCNDALVAQQCCCDIQNAISTNFANLNYNLATQECDTRRAIADSSRDIIDAQNAGTRQILDFLTQDKIASLTSENQALKFAASQANQNVAIGAMMDANTAEILRRTAPIPVPAYLVCNNSGYNYNPGCGYNYNSCGNNFGCSCC